MARSLLLVLLLAGAASAFVPVSSSKRMALRTPSPSARTASPVITAYYGMGGHPYSMGGLALGGGDPFFQYDPYLPYVIQGREFGDYYDPYSEITRGVPGVGGMGRLGYGASIEEARGDWYIGRPMGAYDEYDLNDRFGGPGW